MYIEQFDKCFGWFNQVAAFGDAKEDTGWERKTQDEAKFCIAFSGECSSVYQWLRLNWLKEIPTEIFVLF